MLQHHVAYRINMVPCLAQYTMQVCTTQQYVRQVFQISMHGNSSTKYIFCTADSTGTRHQNHGLLGNFHVSVKYYAHQPKYRCWCLCLSHICSHSNRFSLVPYDTAGVTTTICWQSDSHSLLLRTSAHSHRAKA